jgi:hypothetical protein
MSTKNLDKSEAEAPEQTGLPNTAPDATGLPNVEEKKPNQEKEESWGEVNAKLDKQEERPLDPKVEAEVLRRQLEDERKARAIAEKRMSDTHRENRSTKAEIKALLEQIESLKKQPEPSASHPAPTTKVEQKKILDELELTEEEKDLLEIQPEVKSLLEKMASKLEKGISQYDVKKEEQSRQRKLQELEKDLSNRQHAEWLDGVKKLHSDADKVIETKEFNIWLKSNEDIRAAIIDSKEQYDPSGLAELLDIYKSRQAEIERLKKVKSYGRQSTVAQPTVSQAANDGEESWEDINRKLERSRSNSNRY